MTPALRARGGLLLQAAVLFYFETLRPARLPRLPCDGTAVLAGRRIKNVAI